MTKLTLTTNPEPLPSFPKSLPPNSLRVLLTATRTLCRPLPPLTDEQTNAVTRVTTLAWAAAMDARTWRADENLSEVLDDEFMMLRRIGLQSVAQALQDWLIDNV
jgi:hypothetical protein